MKPMAMVKPKYVPNYADSPEGEESKVDQTPREEMVAKVLTKRLEKWTEWRTDWEERWERAWRRLNNEYEKELGESEGVGWRSKLFYGATRQKCRVARSLIVENVLNTGRAPFDLTTTPIPDSQDSKAFGGELNIEPEERVKNMRKLIHDQFVETKFNKHLFNLISSQVELGTGVLKGPIVTHKKRNSWEPEIPLDIEQAGQQIMEQAAGQAQQQLQAAAQQGASEEELQQLQAQAEQATQQALQTVQALYKENVKYRLKQTEEPSPTFETLDLWDYFPDPDSENPQEGLGVFERQVLTSESFADLALIKDSNGKPMFDEKKIKKLLDEACDDESHTTDYLDHRGPHREDWKGREGEYFAVFTYAGKLTEMDLTDDKAETSETETDLKDYQSTEYIVTMCRGEILSMVENPSKRGLRPYHAAQFSRQPGSPFGWGVPDEMEHAQKAYNGFLRLFIDNKRLAGNLGIVMDQTKIQNPNEALTPGFKLKMKAGADVRQAVMPLTFPDVGGNLLEAMSYCERWGNSSSGIPAFLDGDDTQHRANTAFEANELKTSALKQLGMPIRYLDEDVIVPLVTMMYDWNMENLKDETIKGDFEICAKGYASFKDRTVMGVELRNLLALKAQDPELNGIFDVEEIGKKLAEIGEVPEEHFLLSDEEKNQRAEQEQAAAQAQMQMEADLERMKAQAKAEAEIQVLQAKHQMEMEKLQIDVEIRAQELAMKEKEMAMKEQELDVKRRQFLVDQETKRRKDDMSLAEKREARAEAQRKAQETKKDGGGSSS